MLLSPGPHMAEGPPCISSRSGYFLPASYPIGFITQYSTVCPLLLVNVFFSGKDNCFCCTQLLKLPAFVLFLAVASAIYSSNGLATSVFTNTSLLFTISKLPMPLLGSVSCSTCFVF